MMNLFWFSKRKEFQTEKSMQLDEVALNTDKASFWSCLKSINETIAQNASAPISEETIAQNASAPISGETWLKHFQSLHSNDSTTPIQQQEVYTELQSLEKDQEKLNNLDHEIREQEIYVEQ